MITTSIEAKQDISVKLSVKKFISSNKLTLLLMAIPGIALLLAFYYLPLFGWAYAFFDYKPGFSLWQCDFVGFKYFRQAMLDPDLLPVMRNTFVMSFLALALGPVAPIFAILLSEMRSRRFRKFVQVTTTLPYFISWIIVYSIFFLLLAVDGGLVNDVLIKLGIIEDPLNILADGDIVWIFQSLIGLWKGLGFSAIIYFAAISGIDQELYDAASIDGAGRYHRIRYITVPGLVPTYITLLLISIGNILSNGFDQFYVFSNAMTMEKIQVLDLYIYNVGFYFNNYPLSTAFGVLKIVVSITLLFSANWISKRLQGQSII